MYMYNKVILHYRKDDYIHTQQRTHPTQQVPMEMSTSRQQQQQRKQVTQPGPMETNNTVRDNFVLQIIFMGANFRGKSEKALKIIFRGFKFRYSNQTSPGAWHYTSDNVIDTRALDLACDLLCY